MVIYLLTFPNGKQYIGQTVRMLGTRISQHRQAVNAGSLLPVHCAWRKHGEPSVSILGEYGDMASLHAAEISLIASHGTLAPNGYNVAFGGETAPSKSADVARKISAKAKGRGHTDATRGKIGDASKANWEDEVYRAKVEAGVAASWTPERRAHSALLAKVVHTGRVVSDETKAKLRGRKFSDEVRAKMSASAKARVREKFSEGHCAKISAHVKLAWQDPDVRAQRGRAISAALKAKFANMTDEEKTAFSEQRKRAWDSRRSLKG